MTTLRFIGDLPFWLGLALSIAVSVMSWRYYRRECGDVPGRLKWILPGLRSTAFFLGVLILTGPVLHHRTTIGQLGRVKIYVDGSGSMSLTDRHISNTRKLQIAKQQGWLPRDYVDFSPSDLSGRLQAAATELANSLESESADPGRSESRQRKLLTLIKQTIASAPSTDNAVAELKKAASIFEESNKRPIENVRLLKLCRETSVAASSISKEFESDLNRRIAAGDKSLTAAIDLFDQTPRWRRARRGLHKAGDALLTTLRRSHEVEVISLSGAKAINDPPVQGDDESEYQVDFPEASVTDLSTGVTATQNSDPGASSEPAQRNVGSAIVLISDGQHNSGPAPLQTARLLSSNGTAFYTVAMGASTRAPDLAVTGVEHPDSVFAKDKFAGTIRFTDSMSKGTPVTACVEHEGAKVWKKTILTTGQGERRIDFEFDVEALLETEISPRDSDFVQHVKNLKLAARLEPLEGEAETENNSTQIRFSATVQSSRVLILDGRSRWETRYLRNAFDRDNQWTVSAVIAGPGTDSPHLPRGEENAAFPISRDALNDFDLVVLGELSPGLLMESDYNWLSDFVRKRGGGLILLDGARGYLHDSPNETLQSLLPVRRLDSGRRAAVQRMHLTDSGRQLAAFRFRPNPDSNRSFWKSLPAPQGITTVTALPGTEVLVEAEFEDRPFPAVVTRNDGAGRVIYFASDESWRWRYKAADTIHQRFWNQIALFAGPAPYAASDRYLAIDAGKSSYASGEHVTVRVKLTAADGRPATGRTVDALIQKDGAVVAVASLKAVDDQPGVYRGLTEVLDEGEYQVTARASGFSAEALRATTQFCIEPPESSELSDTSCDERLLRQLAHVSGGSFFREEQMGQLVDALSPLSSGHVVESDTILWQSYWWFAAILILLTAEWWLRKRVGML